MPEKSEFQEANPPRVQPRKPLDDRAVRELTDHLEDLYQEALDRGATDEEARAYVEQRLGETADTAAEILSAARERLGQRMDRWAEEREEALRGRGGVRAAVADRLRDLRVAFRSLTRCPMFTGVVVLVLALGIGATTAIFTLVDAVILSPLPFDEADRLISVRHSAQGRGLQDVGQCAAWHLTYEDEGRFFDDIGMWNWSAAAVTGTGDPEVVALMLATSGVFRALRLDPVIGRGPTPDDEVMDAPKAMFLSYGYWQTRFGGDRDVVGTILEINGDPWEIAGVMPASIRSLGGDPNLIIPMRFDRESLFVGNIGWNGVARLRDGVTLEQAAADALRVLPMAWEKFPGGPVASSSDVSDYAPIFQPLRERLVGSSANLLWILLGGVAVVLLIACANVANLFLVRAEAKGTEMAVRTAIGASRGRVAWEYLKESLLLALLGGVAGLVLAMLCVRLLVAFDLARLPRLEEVSISPYVVLFTFAVSLGSGLFFGLFPVLTRGHKALADTLKQSGQSAMSGRERRRAQKVLAVSQMALTLVLLVASGLMLRSFFALRNVDPGFGNPENVLALRINIPRSLIADNNEAAAMYETIARRSFRDPGGGLCRYGNCHSHGRRQQRQSLLCGRGGSPGRRQRSDPSAQVGRRGIFRNDGDPCSGRAHDQLDRDPRARSGRDRLGKPGENLLGITGSRARREGRGATRTGTVARGGGCGGGRARRRLESESPRDGLLASGDVGLLGGFHVGRCSDVARYGFRHPRRSSPRS